MKEFLRKYWLWFCLPIYFGLMFYFYNFTTFLSDIDFSMFKDTPIWELAKAVKANDPNKIKKLMTKYNYDINYRDLEKGKTLLSYAIANSRSLLGKTKYETIKALLECGSDPNAYGLTVSSKGRLLNGSNPVIIAAKKHNHEVLKLLLDYGGDPNSQNRGSSITGPYDHTALLTAIREPLGFESEDDRYQCVKLLVEVGADIDKKTQVYEGGALNACMSHRQMRIMFYLLQKGANYNTSFRTFIYNDKEHEKQRVDILFALRECVFDLDSENYRYKRKIIDFLKRNGLDYDSCPIPSKIIDYIKKEYPTTWKEYIKVY